MKRAGYQVGSTGYRAPGTRYPVMDSTKYLVPSHHYADPEHITVQSGLSQTSVTGSGRDQRDTPLNFHIMEFDHKSGLWRRDISHRVSTTIPLDPADPASMGYP